MENGAPLGSFRFAGEYFLGILAFRSAGLRDGFSWRWQRQGTLGSWDPWDPSRFWGQPNQRVASFFALCFWRGSFSTQLCPTTRAKSWVSHGKPLKVWVSRDQNAGTLFPTIEGFGRLPCSALKALCALHDFQKRGKRRVVNGGPTQK